LTAAISSTLAFFSAPTEPKAVSRRFRRTGPTPANASRDVYKRQVHAPRIEAEAECLGTAVIELSAADRTAPIRAARAIIVAEVIGDADEKAVIEDLLVDEGGVVARIALTAGPVTSARVENELLEVVGIRVVAFVGRYLR